MVLEIHSRYNYEFSNDNCFGLVRYNGMLYCSIKHIYIERAYFVILHRKKQEYKL